MTRSAKAPAYTVEMRHVAKVKPYPANAKAHSEAAVTKLAALIQRFGFRVPIVVDAKGVILKGHRTFRAALKLGMMSVPVHIATGLSAAEARAWRVADNRVAEDTKWDDALLRIEVGELHAEGFDLKLTGFDGGEIEALLNGQTGAAASALGAVGEDLVPPPPKHPTTQPGDCISLGSHRPFFRDIVRASAAVLKSFGHLYVCCDWRSWASWWEVAKGTGIVPKNMIVWDKGGAGLGSNYANTHELLLFASYVPLQQNMTQKITGMRSVNASNLWRIARERSAGTEGGRVHNAQKPVELVRKALEHSTDPGDTVVDFFGGSGTTLLACEQMGRFCRMAEIAPAYCDVIVQRWEQATGHKADRPSRAEVA